MTDLQLFARNHFPYVSALRQSYVTALAAVDEFDHLDLSAYADTDTVDDELSEVHPSLTLGEIKQALSVCRALIAAVQDLSPELMGKL